ncbi:hypothetical protein EDC01DRAFT_619960 [Geopyxis carbonaria]|nr:hypothetical protein EDC01DRAFT_619960 [Geopyxis carbonaria]
MDKKKEFGQHFWSVLCEIISSGNEGSFLPGNSEQLFGAAICTFAFIGDVEISSLDLPALFNTWIEQLCTQPVTEAVGRPQENHVIMGYARLLRLCLRFAHHHPVAKRSRIMSKLWQELLFPNLVNCAMEISKTIPILHEDTRTELYNLLLDMVRTPDDLRQLVLYNHELFDGGVTLPDVCYIERDRWLLGPTGIGGLQNLSNTCYLNSLVTQLFMNRSFRDFILQLPIDESEDARRTSFCLQVLFARMQEGFDRAADPKDLVESLRDFAGEPIDPTVQMDVDEFFNLLFDRLESEMSGNETRSLFRSFYGGLLVQQVKSKECPHISERTEAFSAIQCDIKGKSTLQESLKAYVEGEAMEGDNKYRCTTCDRLVDAVKRRTCLKDIPDHLILHLKRFDFDLQTMHRSKINDFFEFPITLDMAPYSMSHLSTLESGRDPADSSSDDFELVGVLVHTGTAESGHYYSYIRDRLIKQEIPSWFEFNDSEVTFFNPSTIPAACYGGSDNFPGGGYSPNKSFSAYMLFYQRSASLKTSQFAQDLSAINLKDSPIGSLCLQISQDNQNLLKQYCMCGTNYTAFLQGIISTGYKFSTLNFKDGEQILLLALRGLEKICSRFKDCGEWDRLLAIIQKLIMNNEHYCKYFLEWASDEQIIRSLIISNPFSAVRQTFSRMILAELDRLRHIAPALYGMNDLEDSVTSQSKCILYKICAGFSDTWNWLQYNPKSWCEYFGTLISVCMLGPNECECVLSTGILKNILQMLSDVYVDESRVNIRFQNFQKILEKPRLQAATKPAKLLNLLMARTSIFLRPCKDENARISTPTRPFPLTVDEHRIALSRESLGCNFLSRLIELPGTTNEAKKLIFNIVSTPNAPAEHRHLKTILRTLMYGVDIDPAAQAQPFLECLKSFVSATSSEVYIEDIIKKVADEIPTIGASGGSEHLAFFQGLTELHGPKTNAVPSLILKYISSWAPTLLMYHDEEVRDGTEQLLEEILFSALEESHCSKKPIECLTNGCFEFINGKLPNLRQGLDEHTFKNALRVLDRSGEWQENAEDFNSRLDDIKCHIERLIFEEEGDGPELESGKDSY